MKLLKQNSILTRKRILKEGIKLDKTSFFSERGFSCFFIINFKTSSFSQKDATNNKYTLTLHSRKILLIFTNSFYIILNG